MSSPASSSALTRLRHRAPRGPAVHKHPPVSITISQLVPRQPTLPTARARLRTSRNCHICSTGHGPRATAASPSSTTKTHRLRIDVLPFLCARDREPSQLELPTNVNLRTPVTCPPSLPYTDTFYIRAPPPSVFRLNRSEIKLALSLPRSLSWPRFHALPLPAPPPTHGSRPPVPAARASPALASLPPATPSSTAFLRPALPQ